MTNFFSKFGDWMVMVVMLCFFIITPTYYIQIGNLKEHVHRLEARVLVIESNRFTSSDASQLMATILGMLPPDWLITEVRALEDSVHNLEKEIYRREGE